MPQPRRQAAVVASAERVGTIYTRVRLHQAGRFLIHQRGMLDRMDAGTNRIFHSRGTMRVGGDFSPGSRRFVNGGAEFFERHLCLIRRSPRRQHPTGSDHFDDFRASLNLFLHDFSDLLGGLPLPAR